MRPWAGSSKSTYNVVMVIEVPTPRPIAAAAIVDSWTQPTRLLCTARAYPEQLRGMFEFPGGKVEPGETWEEALRREVFEELGVDVLLGPELEPPGSLLHWPILHGHQMRVWVVTVDPPTATPQIGESHCVARWMALTEVQSLPWLAADRPIVDHLVKQYGVSGGGPHPFNDSVE